MGRLSRREALKKMGTVIGMGVSIPVVSSYLVSCSDSSSGPSSYEYQLDLSTVQGLENTGSIVKVQNSSGNTPASLFVMKTAENEYMVMSAICTHQSCSLNPPGQSNSNIWCGCHGSQFNPQSGSVVNGPANAPLAQYTAVYDPQTNLLTITI